MPFSQLSGDDFEIFSFLLLLREHPGETIYYYGKSHDSGRDIMHKLPSGSVRLVQCKCYSKNVGTGELRAELAKLFINVFNKTIPERPDEVAFYVAPQLTSPATRLLDDQNEWRSCAEEAIKAHLGETPDAELLEFALAWWPKWDRQESLSLTERCRPFPELRDEFFGVRQVIDASREEIRHDIDEALARYLRTPGDPPQSLDSSSALLDDTELKQAFVTASESLLTWPTTLANSRWLERDELDEITRMVESSSSSTTLVIGEPGSGKSALLARLGKHWQEAGDVVLAIKADKLDVTVDSAAKLAERLRLPSLPIDCVCHLAQNHRVIVLIDQLDALADLLDLRSERLNVLLDFIKALHGIKDVHVAASCREFEHRHDVRLTSIDTEELRLRLPTWEQVAEILQSHSIDAAHWPERFRDSLRIPQHLKVFLQCLRGTKEVQVFASYQEMLDDLWTRNISNADGVPGRSELVMEMAEAMAQDETLWLPVARFEDHAEIVANLESVGVLCRPNQGPRVGFQHQTIFEHARARAFARGQGSLAKHILERQNSLFVRPTAWSTLNYLRAASPATYETEMQQLCDSTLRLHMKYLLIEFLGQVGDPSDQEFEWLQHWYDTPRYRNKVLLAVRGNAGWFSRMVDGHLPALMQQSPSNAWPAVGVLQQAWRFARPKCIELIRNHWIKDPSKDELTLNAFQELAEWDRDAVQLVCDVIGRTDSKSFYPMYLAGVVSAHSPDLAPLVIGAYLNRQLEKTQTEVGESPDLPPGDSDDAKHIRDSNVYRKKSRFKELLESRDNLHELPAIAEAAPKAFLDAVWPWFIDAFKQSLEEPHRVLVCFRASYCLAEDLDREQRPNYPIFDAMDIAVRLLAKDRPEEFLEFLTFWRSTDAAFVQRLLCRALTNIADAKSDAALEFVLGDPRRLMLGNHDDRFGDTRALIRALIPNLSAPQVERLEATIVTSTRYRDDIAGDDVQTRFQRKKWDREWRLRLLKTIPFDRLSTKTQALVRAEEEALPEYRDQDGFGKCSPFIGSFMSSEQMARASNDQIVSLFDKLTDDTEWRHPSGHRRGGSVQASQAVAELAKQNPDRVAEIARRLRAEDQQHPVNHIIQALGQSEYPFESLTALVTDLSGRGFDGREFRVSVADACRARTAVSSELPDDLCDLLERWLADWDYSRDDTDSDGASGGEQDRSESVLWIPGGSFVMMLPGGSYRLVQALAMAFRLKDPPQYERWLSLLRGYLQRSVSSEMWRSLTHELWFLSHCEPERATKLLLDVFEKFPGVRDCRHGAILVARSRWFLPDPAYQRVLHALRASNWRQGPQAYGELLSLSVLAPDKHTWAAAEAQELLNPADDGPTTLGARLGLCFGVASLWRECPCKAQATDLFAQLAPFAEKQGDLAEALMNLFLTDRFYVDEHSRRVLEVITDNPGLLAVSTVNYLVERLEDRVSTDRDLVHRLSTQIVDKRSEELIDFRTSFSMSASRLTNIALTLQRAGNYREKGLALFEKLLEIGVSDAGTLLNDLDCRPVNVRSRVRRRTRRTT